MMQQLNRENIKSWSKNDNEMIDEKPSKEGNY